MTHDESVRLGSILFSVPVALAVIVFALRGWWGPRMGRPGKPPKPDSQVR